MPASNMQVSTTFKFLVSVKSKLHVVAHWIATVQEPESINPLVIKFLELWPINSLQTEKLLSSTYYKAGFRWSMTWENSSNSMSRCQNPKALCLSWGFKAK